MTIREMLILIEVSKCSNMTTAGYNLFVSQSNISQVIINLEKKYNITIFHRHSKKLILTDEGKILVDYSKKIVELHNEMEQRINNASFNKINIGTTLITASSILNYLWKEYHIINPSIKTSIAISDNYELEYKLLNENLDFILSENYFNNPTLKCTKFYEDEYVLIFNKDSCFYGRDSVVLQELFNKSFAVRELGNPTRELIEKIINSYKINLNIVNCFCNIDSLIEDVVNKNSISIISKKLLEQEKFYNIFFCNISDLYDKRSFYLTYHKDKILKKYLSDFIDLCEKLSSH